MFVADTGDLTSASPTLAGALIFVGASVMVAAVSSWLNRRPKRRRTGPAPSPPDVIPMHQRLTVNEEHVSDLHDAVIVLQTQQTETFRRLNKLEDKP